MDIKKTSGVTTWFICHISDFRSMKQAKKFAYIHVDWQEESLTKKEN